MNLHRHKRNCSVRHILYHFQVYGSNYQTSEQAHPGFFYDWCRFLVYVLLNVQWPAQYSERVTLSFSQGSILGILKRVSLSPTTDSALIQ